MKTPRAPVPIFLALLLAPSAPAHAAPLSEAGQAPAGQCAAEGAAKTGSCPALTGKRVFTPEELTKAAGSGRSQFDERAFQARLARLNPGWASPGDPGSLPAVASSGGSGAPGGRRNAVLPASQLTQGFRVWSPSPPEGGGAAHLPYVLDHPVEGKPVEFKLTGPKTQANFSFRGTKADALAWTATYADGAQFAIIAPKNDLSAYSYATVRQAANAASYLLKDSRALIKTILINRISNPDDAHWAKAYKTPGFQSYMTAGADGIVDIYPCKKGQITTAGEMRSSMLHETGHTWSEKTWGVDTTKNGWVDWKKAMEEDKTWVSQYAKSSIGEDVAETIEAYGSTLGSADFGGFQKQVPHRFAILAKEFK